MSKWWFLLFFSVVSSFLPFTASANSGPSKAWNVFTLPNPDITPAWRTYATTFACKDKPGQCAKDSRFWEQWDFSNFQDAIDNAFASVKSEGKYQGVMMILPLGDTSKYWNNIRLVYASAKAHGVGLQFALFPKWKFGNEWCYLYNEAAPSGCKLATGTTQALAYQKLLNLMKFVQNLGGACGAGGYNNQFAAWYGWGKFSPGYAALKRFWLSLPTSAGTNGCSLQASYLIWLDTSHTGNTDVQQLQDYVVKTLKKPLWVNTELYSATQIEQFADTYQPYQTVVSGFWGATTIRDWAQGMCATWKTAQEPTRLGVWTFSDRDISPFEQYRSYINENMASVGAICTY